MTKDPNALVKNKDLDEAVEAITNGMDRMIKEFRAEVSSSFKKVEERFDKVDAEIGWVKDDISGLKADLSDTVSKKEFNQLKGKVDKFLTS